MEAEYNKIVDYSTIPVARDSICKSSSNAGIRTKSYLNHLKDVCVVACACLLDLQSVLADVNTAKNEFVTKLLECYNKYGERRNEKYNKLKELMFYDKEDFKFSGKENYYFRLYMVEVLDLLKNIDDDVLAVVNRLQDTHGDKKAVDYLQWSLALFKSELTLNEYPRL